MTRYRSIGMSDFVRNQCCYVRPPENLVFRCNEQCIRRSCRLQTWAHDAVRRGQGSFTGRVRLAKKV